VNLGNPTELKIRDLAETVVRLTGSKAELIFKPLPSDDPVKRKPDTSKAKDILGWEPTVELEDGIRSVISYFAKAMDMPVPFPAEVQTAVGSQG
jgi:UDP-glucuronate decarboxylase